MEEKGILIVISGFSGAGKGTLVKGLLRRYDEYALSVSMTTRSPRPGEQEGVEYFFTDRERFEEVIAKGGLVEYAQYCGNYYGTPRAYVEDQLAAGKNVILELKPVSHQYRLAVRRLNDILQGIQLPVMDATDIAVILIDRPVCHL